MELDGLAGASCCCAIANINFLVNVLYLYLYYTVIVCMYYSYVPLCGLLYGTRTGRPSLSILVPVRTGTRAVQVPHIQVPYTGTVPVYTYIIRGRMSTARTPPVRPYRAMMVMMYEYSTASVLLIYKGLI